MLLRRKQGLGSRLFENQVSAVLGSSSTALTFIAWVFKLVHPYFYLAISICLCIVIGYIASLFFPAPTRSLRGLTIHRDRDGE